MLFLTAWILTCLSGAFFIMFAICWGMSELTDEIKEEY